MDDICLELIKGVMDSQEDLVTIFKEDELIVTNKAFNSFVNISSTEQYKDNFKLFEDGFVPHPAYFNKENIHTGKTWIESILELDEMDRIVSMLDYKCNAHAFNVKIDDSVEGFSIVTFEDITQTLIKRIMIENHSNIERKSGAYDKQYFLHVMKSYEDAAIFNEKIIGLITVEINGCEDNLVECVHKFKNSVRQDDMFVHWGHGRFLLVHLVDSALKSQEVLNKLKVMANKEMGSNITCKFGSLVQDKKEKISHLIERLEF